NEHRVILWLFDALGTVRIANVATEPSFLGAPINVLIGFPGIFAPASETEGLESHCFEGHVAREDHQVGPRNLAAVFLFDWPQESPRLVEADVVRPTIQWSKPLLAPTA